MKTTLRSLLLFLIIACFGVAAYSEQSGNIYEIASYDQEQTFPDWENPSERLPYAMMSYFAEVSRIAGRKPRKQKAIDQRLAYLTAQGYVQMDEKNIPENWLNRYQGGDLKRINDDKTGFRARMFINEPKKTITLAIAGTDFGDLDSILSAFYLSYGYSSEALVNGVELARNLRDKFQEQGYRLEITGASQGGAIAMMAAYATDSVAYVFNSQMPHASLLADVEDNQKTRIKHAFIEGDMLNDSIHPAAFVVQNSLSVETLEIMIFDEMQEEIEAVYYQQHGWAGYYTATTPWIMHWTGTVLYVSERLAGVEFADLYAKDNKSKKSAN